MATGRYRDEAETVTAPTPAPRGNDAYTGMLIISLAALILGCILLLLEFLSYDGTKPPQVTLPALPKAGAPAPSGPGASGAPGNPAVPPITPAQPGR
jgi:hypothetical protein